MTRLDLGRHWADVAKLQDQMARAQKEQAERKRQLTSLQQQIKVVVPPGVAPGQTFNVCANGRNIPVTVPPGCAPGTTLMINA